MFIKLSLFSFIPSFLRVCFVLVLVLFCFVFSYPLISFIWICINIDMLIYFIFLYFIIYIFIFITLFYFFLSGNGESYNIHKWEYLLLTLLFSFLKVYLPKILLFYPIAYSINPEFLIPFKVFFNPQIIPINMHIYCLKWQPYDPVNAIKYMTMNLLITLYRAWRDTRKVNTVREIWDNCKENNEIFWDF